MKKAILLMLTCVIFICSLSVQAVFAFTEEQINFYYNGKVFTYCLSENIKTSSQFDVNFEINKYNRFGNKEERINLLSKMLKAGLEEKVALNYLFPSLDETVLRIEKTINKQAKNASLKINSSTEKVFYIQEEKAGVCLDRQALYKTICKNYLNDTNLEIIVPTIPLMPNILAKDFKTFSNLRADFSTDISSSSEDRKHNIKNAMQSLNKFEVLPNQVFSFNKVVGKRTEENGYRNAKIIVNNEFVDGVGGGVCQVSSTLYNSALLAGLEIIEANRHSKQVGYVKYGFDAMVNFGSSDLKFRNNTSEKLTIITNCSSTKARIRIFGESLGNTKYKLKNEIVKIEEPIEEILLDETQQHLEKVVYNDEFFYLKKPTKGMEVKSYREKYVDDILVETTLLRFDKFKVQNGIKVYGVKPRENLSSILIA